MKQLLVSLLLASCAACGQESPGGSGPEEDGTPSEWIRGSAPQLAPGPAAWDADNLISPTVIKTGGLYRMWFDGASNATGVIQVGTATSPDGTTWTKHPSNPVLSPAGGWESGGIGMTTVLFDGTTFRMWYTGVDAAGAWRVGLATSTDGVAWTRHPSNPILSPTAAWENGKVGGPTVIYGAPVYRMWYMGGDRIGLATSTDGVAWTKHAANPVMAGTVGGWDERLEGPCVIEDSGRYRMWYGGNRGDEERIGAAESTDGIAWTKAPAPSLRQGQPASWDENDVWGMSVMRDGTQLRMWYTGDRMAGTSQIGLAIGR